MKRKKLLLGLALSLIVVSVATWAGYKGGFSWGLANGYTQGYNAGLASFPRLDMDNITFTDGVNSIYIGQLTITGEQHILDMINELPNMSNIISIK